MAGCRSAFISIIIYFVLSGSPADCQDVPVLPEPRPDSTASDSLAAIDSLDIDIDADSIIVEEKEALSDSVAEPQVIYFPDDDIPPYYQTIIAGKSYGDYLRYKTGILSLQHGSLGQAEILTKSVMLSGLGVTYNNQPFFHQGMFFPLRSGADLTVLMFESVSWIEISPLYKLDLFNQGEALSLRSMFWPPDDNPSSITVAKGPFDYERSGWRFSRRFTDNAAMTFCAGFKESNGYYTYGADYDDFSVNGSFAYRPKPNSEYIYSFYQHKAKQGILQFDRLPGPEMRSNNDQNFHSLKTRYFYSEKLNFELSLLRQKNNDHLFDNNIDFHHFARDDIWAGESAAYYKTGKNNLSLKIGGHRQLLLNDRLITARSVTASLILSDSIAVSNDQDFVFISRIRHNNLDNIKFAGTIKYGKSLTESSRLILSAGKLDYLPDLYARYFNHPDIIPSDGATISSYSYIPNPDLNSTRLLFAKAEFNHVPITNLRISYGLSYEKTYDDRLPVIVGDTLSVWNTTQENIDYDRLTFTIDIDYSLTKYFTGYSGATYFKYNPSGPNNKIAFTPSAMFHSVGELKIDKILRGVDVSGVYQFKYLSAREYSGMILNITGRGLYEAAVSLDASLIIQFGSFQFRLSEDNVLDYIFGNDYNVWGEYSMPPRAVWWQFTWDFTN